MRSFSNLWYWIALAVMWSTASHWVLGVPFDMITRARRLGGQAETDLQDMVRINVNRLLFIARLSGLWILAFVCFILSMLIGLGFVYDVEFAQAVFFLAFPMTIVGVLSLNSARLIEGEGFVMESIYKRLRWHRISTQGIGMVAIFITSMWGMFRNLSLGVLGG